MKILICGSVHGHLFTLFQKVTKLMSISGPFDMLFCVGEFLGPDVSEFMAYKEGRLVCPIPTFFLGPINTEYAKHYPDVNGCEICHNLVYLGHKGIFTSDEGLKLAYLSGVENGDANWGLQAVDGESLESELVTPTFEGVDIFLSSAFPLNVDNLTDPLPKDSFPPEMGSKIVADVALKIMPRYHFTSGGMNFYERIPYRNHRVLQEKPKHVTRFIAIADFYGNTAGTKNLYAFSIIPLCSAPRMELLQSPPKVTDCPYNVFKNSESLESSPSNFFFDMSPTSRGPPRSEKSQGVVKMPCWFCLGEEHSEKHLVFSVGTHSYLSLAKGGLTENHCLIVPISHIRSSRDCSTPVLSEMIRYKEALINAFQRFDFICVFFERNFKTTHMQIQCVPLPKIKLPYLRSTFLEHFNKISANFVECSQDSDISRIIAVNEPFFVVDFPGGHRIVSKIDPRTFPLQFGRIALASEKLLNVPSRAIDWKICVREASEEKIFVKSLAAIIKDFDPALTAEH